MNRRNFVQATAAGALAAAAAPAAGSKMIGIQVGAVSFVDEGVEKVLDVFQKDAAVNTLFIATFTYGRGIAGRQVPGQPLPDHGKQQYDNGSGPGTFQGGSLYQVSIPSITKTPSSRSSARPISAISTCWKPSSRPPANAA